MAALFRNSKDSPGAGVEQARKYLVEQMTKAAQTIFPLGLVLVIADDLISRDGYVCGSVLVMAMDETRPHDRDVVAGAADAQLGRQGWTTTTVVDGEYLDVRARHSDIGDFLITVLCNNSNPVTEWNGHTPYFPA